MVTGVNRLPFLDGIISQVCHTPDTTGGFHTGNKTPGDFTFIETITPLGGDPFQHTGQVRLPDDITQPGNLAAGQKCLAGSRPALDGLLLVSQHVVKFFIHRETLPCNTYRGLQTFCQCQLAIVCGEVFEAGDFTRYGRRQRPIERVVTIYRTVSI